jgi:dienelactone hydrolase
MITRHVLDNATPVQVDGDRDAPRALIVLQEAFGVNDHIRSLVEMFAREGFYAVAPELFHRTGSPEVPYDDFPAAMTSRLTSFATNTRTTDLTVTVVPPSSTPPPRRTPRSAHWRSSSLRSARSST